MSFFQVTMGCKPRIWDDRVEEPLKPTPGISKCELDVLGIMPVRANYILAGEILYVLDWGWAGVFAPHKPWIYPYTCPESTKKLRKCFPDLLHGQGADRSQAGPLFWNLLMSLTDLSGSVGCLLLRNAWEQEVGSILPSLPGISWKWFWKRKSKGKSEHYL